MTKKYYYNKYIVHYYELHMNLNQKKLTCRMRGGERSTIKICRSVILTSSLNFKLVASWKSVRILILANKG